MKLLAMAFPFFIASTELVRLPSMQFMYGAFEFRFRLNGYVFVFRIVTVFVCVKQRPKNICDTIFKYSAYEYTYVQIAMQIENIEYA